MVRKCGGCVVCCSVFGVEEIQKDPWTGCPNLNSTGCLIYQDRPAKCREFYCLWQGGLGDMGQRPDRLGVVFAHTNGKTEFTRKMEYQAYEVKPGAFGDAKVIALAKSLARSSKLIIGHRYGGKMLTFLGPKGKIKAAQEWVKRKNKGT